MFMIKIWGIVVISKLSTTSETGVVSEVVDNFGKELQTLTKTHFHMREAPFGHHKLETNCSR